MTLTFENAHTPNHTHTFHTSHCILDDVAGGPGEAVRLSEQRRPREKLDPLDAAIQDGYAEAEHKKALAANIKRLTV